MSQHIDAVAKQSGLDAVNSKITPSGLKNGNIDTYFESDVCWIQSANSSGSQPGFNYYQLEIIPNGNGQVVQRATEMSNSRIANRLYANGAWSPWEPAALSREITALISNMAKCTQIEVDVSMTIAESGIGQIFTNLTLGTSSLVDKISNNQLYQLFSGKTIYGAVCIYATSVGMIPDTLVEGNKLSLRLYNATASSVSVTSVRLLIFSSP